MYPFFKSMTAGSLKIELPALSFSLLIAEMFFHFGSFTLEALGFLALWYFLSYVLNKIAEKDK